jgi:hypothetical protein
VSREPKDGFLHAHLLDGRLADVFEDASIPVVRVTFRLLPVRPGPDMPWISAVELEIGDPPPLGLSPASVFETIHDMLPSLQDEARRSWVAQREAKASES